MRVRMLFRTILCVMIGLVSVCSGGRATAEPAGGIRYGAIPEGSYSVVAVVRAKLGKEAALREATLPLVRLVRSDPKNLVYFLQEDREVPGRFVFYEIFATRADFEAHNNMPYVKDWFARLPELADGGVTVTHMEILRGNGKP